MIISKMQEESEESRFAPKLTQPTIHLVKGRPGPGDDDDDDGDGDDEDGGDDDDDDGSGIRVDVG